MKIKQVNMIEVGDWDDLVMNTYNRPYNFQQQDNCKDRGTFDLTVPATPSDYENDSIPEIVNGNEMGVSFAAWLARDPLTPIPKEERSYGADFTDLWWERNFYPDVQMIANDLHTKGLLEAGEYVINIDW